MYGVIKSKYVFEAMSVSTAEFIDHIGFAKVRYDCPDTGGILSLVERKGST